MSDIERVLIVFLGPPILCLVIYVVNIDITKHMGKRREKRPMLSFAFMLFAIPIALSFVGLMTLVALASIDIDLDSTRALTTSYSDFWHDFAGDDKAPSIPVIVAHTILYFILVCWLLILFEFALHRCWWTYRSLRLESYLNGLGVQFNRAPANDGHGWEYTIVEEESADESNVAGGLR